MQKQVLQSVIMVVGTSWRLVDPSSLFYLLFSPNIKMSNTPEQKPPGLLKKLKEKMDDKEEQLNILSTFVRLGILIWSGGILTLTYVTIPMLPQQKIDPTFIASVFTGTLATFGVQTAKNKGKDPSAAGTGTPTQIIKIEQKPIKIITED